MPCRLLNWVIKMLLCDVGICFPPFFRKSNFGYYKLRPFLAVVISVYIASIVLGFDSNDAILANNDVVDLCCAFFVFNTMSHNIWYSFDKWERMSFTLCSPRLPFCFGEEYHHPREKRPMMITSGSMDKNDCMNYLISIII